MYGSTASASIGAASLVSGDLPSRAVVMLTRTFCSLLWDVVRELFPPSHYPRSLFPLLLRFPFFYTLYLCFSFSPLTSASVTMQRASFGRASVSIATVQAPTPQSGPRLRFGATLLVPCPLCIPAKPYLPVSRSGTDINCPDVNVSLQERH